MGESQRVIKGRKQSGFISAYTDEEKCRLKAAFLAIYLERECIRAVACREIGLNYRTLNAWRKADNEFNLACCELEAHEEGEMEQRLKDFAKGKIELDRNKINVAFSATKFWLEHRHPEFTMGIGGASHPLSVIGNAQIIIFNGYEDRKKINELAKVASGQMKLPDAGEGKK